MYYKTGFHQIGHSMALSYEITIELETIETSIM